ncbi:unnamed protein product [Hermetia illucens]|uniref:O-acyltransferase WSD1 C-terminal domain-containing protein n=1 Tax=Hermetia illucens TaxID=343691 RepID=A0A7R8V8G4_HERIL|nr:unnamed protein product [Hermetia illucens]
MPDLISGGRLVVFCLGIVRGLLIKAVKTPPTILNEANAVWGTSCPKITVAPINGAVSSHILAHTIVENAQICFFSALTNSVVHVVKSASVEDMADLDIIADSIKSATRLLPLTEMKIKNNY